MSVVPGSATRAGGAVRAAAASPGVKRAFDAVVAGFVLVVAAPVLAVVAAAIGAESRGGVLFRQERVGLQGRTFRIHKFRTCLLYTSRCV